MFDPVCSDPPLLLSPINLSIEQRLGDKLHLLILVCIAREFFFSWESACDQHRANQCCPDRSQG
ncbi:unnamed protein product, partial [Staurois parvus]